MSTDWLNNARDEESQADPQMLTPVGQCCGIEIFVQAGDVAFTHLADDAGGKRDLLAVGELGFEQMLLDEAAFEDIEPAPRVMALGDVADEALQHLEILVGGDRRAVIVVPDDRIGRVDVAHGFKVAALDRVEETLRQLARRFVWHACLLQPPARALVMTISSPGAILCPLASFARTIVPPCRNTILCRMPPLSLKKCRASAGLRRARSLRTAPMEVPSAVRNRSPPMTGRRMGGNCTLTVTSRRPRRS